MRLLNVEGYGGREFCLELVYNPVGAFCRPLNLPWKLISGGDFMQTMGYFNHLYTITNMPINRFASQPTSWEHLMIT
jgi:hypothetical protein